jgi:pyocin large subunit-like protein
VASRKTRSALIGLIPALLAVIGLIAQSFGSSGADAGSSRSRRSTPAFTAEVLRDADDQRPVPSRVPSTVDANAQARQRIGFRSKSKFDSHFVKHGREFGSISKSEYLRRAQQLRDAPLSDDIIEARQARGNFARFDRRSGAFMAFEEDLVILTFFRPDDGEEYFQRAVRRKT